MFGKFDFFKEIILLCKQNEQFRLVKKYAMKSVIGGEKVEIFI